MEFSIIIIIIILLMITLIKLLSQNQKLQNQVHSLVTDIQSTNRIETINDYQDRSFVIIDTH